MFIKAYCHSYNNSSFFQYWPSRGTETYGVMCVTLTDTQELATYVIRTFQLQRVSSAHVRHPSYTSHATQSDCLQPLT